MVNQWLPLGRRRQLSGEITYAASDALAPCVYATRPFMLRPLLITLEQCLLEIPNRLRRCSARDRDHLDDCVALPLEVVRRHVLDEQYLIRRSRTANHISYRNECLVTHVCRAAAIIYAGTSEW